MTTQTTPRSPRRRGLAVGLLVVGIAVLFAMLVLLRLGVATDYLYHALVKDPPRTAPQGNVLVSPADGHVLYVRRIHDGTIPYVVKRGVPVPVVEHVRGQPRRPLREGWLIGIFMNTHGVHVNRMPNHGTVRERWVYNGPHLDMSDAEREVILRSMIPGATTLRKLLRGDPYDIENRADFVLQSARETLVIEDERGATLYVVRIADYWVGKILTWVEEGQSVKRGQKLGLITWGSQTDLFIEHTPGLEVRVEAGAYVHGGETILATY